MEVGRGSDCRDTWVGHRRASGLLDAVGLGRERGPATECRLWSEAAMGFGCQGGFCDNVDLKCMTLPYGITLVASSNNWTPFFSEENNFSATFSTGWRIQRTSPARSRLPM